MRLATLRLLLLAATLLAGPLPSLAQAPDPLFDDLEEDAGPDAFPDPLESVNRWTFAFNQQVDRWLLDPITHGYRHVVPDFAKRAVSRLVFNLNSPVFLANDVFQGRFEAAGITLWRFTINTTVGVGGLLDVGAWLDVPGHRSDFGQTLALWGVGSGPYLIVPVLGPTTVRDGFGSIVDLLLRPTTYLLAPADQLMFSSIHGGGSGLALRESSIEGLRALRESSVDFYAALRSAYFQNRMAEIDEHSKEDALKK